MSKEPPLRVSPEVVAQDLGDGIVLLNLRTGIYWGLNRTGAVVWRGMEKSASVEKISRELRAEFECAGENLDAAVRKLLSELLAQRLIVEEGARSREAVEAGEDTDRRAPLPYRAASARGAREQGLRIKAGGRKISRMIPKKG
jgi:hypothetical protein